MGKSSWERAAALLESVIAEAEFTVPVHGQGDAEASERQRDMLGRQLPSYPGAGRPPGELDGYWRSVASVNRARRGPACDLCGGPRGRLGGRLPDGRPCPDCAPLRDLE